MTGPYRAAGVGRRRPRRLAGARAVTQKSKNDRRKIAARHSARRYRVASPMYCRTSSFAAYHTMHFDGRNRSMSSSSPSGLPSTNRATASPSALGFIAIAGAALRAREPLRLPSRYAPLVHQIRSRSALRRVSPGCRRAALRATILNSTDKPRNSPARISAAASRPAHRVGQRLDPRSPRRPSATGVILMMGAARACCLRKITPSAGQLKAPGANVSARSAARSLYVSSTAVQHARTAARRVRSAFNGA